MKTWSEVLDWIHDHETWEHGGAYDLEVEYESGRIECVQCRQGIKFSLGEEEE